MADKIDAVGICGSDGELQFFAEPGLDRLAAVMLHLASEVWVQDERLRALETATGTAVPVSKDQLLKQFIDRVFSPLREPVQRSG